MSKQVSTVFMDGDMLSIAEAVCNRCYYYYYYFYYGSCMHLE